MARTVVAPPSSVVKCLWEVFVLGVWGVVLVVCVSVSGVLFPVGVCVCDLFLFFTDGRQSGWRTGLASTRSVHAPAGDS